MESKNTPSEITASRRSVLLGSIGAVAAAAVSLPGLTYPGMADAATPKSTHQGDMNMESGYITLKDGVEIYYKDWGPKDAPVVFFHHGWPLTSDDWDSQMMYFLQHGYRVVAHDRRGHGRSTQTNTGNNMNTYCADVAEVVAALKRCQSGLSGSLATGLVVHWMVR